MNSPPVSQIAPTVDAEANGLIAQGQHLYDTASAASGGDYAGLMGAVGALVNDLPAGAVASAAHDIMNVVGSAAQGAALGATFGPYGAAIGAAVGAVVGMIEDAFSSPPPPPPQGECRSTADQLCFPAVAKGTALSVVPGMACDNPRRAPGSLWYQVDGDGTTQSTNYAFAVSWMRPPNATPTTQAAAWYLAQWFVASLSANSGALCTTGAVARSNAGTAMGGDDVAARAFDRLAGWYGRRFSKCPPWSPEDLQGAVRGAGGWQGAFGAFAKVQTRMLVSLKGVLLAFGGWEAVHRVSPTPTVADIAAVTTRFTAYPLDFLYYPIPVSFNDTPDMGPVPVGGIPEGVLMCADTLLLGLAELAVQQAHDVVALHYVMGLAWLWKRTKATAALTDPTVTQAHHPNFVRVIGVISRKIRVEMGKGPMKVGVLTPSASTGRLLPMGSWWLLAGMLIVSGGLLLRREDK